MVQTLGSVDGSLSQNSMRELGVDPQAPEHARLQARDFEWESTTTSAFPKLYCRIVLLNQISTCS